MDIGVRIKYLRQIIGYYLLLLLCQIGGELAVVFISGGFPAAGFDGDAMLEQMLTLLAARTYSVLLATYVIMGLILIFKKLKSPEPLVLSEGFSNKPSMRALFWGVVMGASGCLWSSIVIELLPRQTSVIERFGSQAQEIVNVDPVWMELVAVVLAASFFEELIFRGLIFSRMRVLMTPTAAVIGQALIFASMYTGINMVYSFFMGLILGLVVIRARSLWAAVCVHMAFNLATYIANPFYDAIFSGKQTTLIVLVAGGVVFALSGYFYFANEKNSSAGADS